MFKGVFFFEVGEGVEGREEKGVPKCSKIHYCYCATWCDILETNKRWGTVQVPNFRQRLRKTCPPRIHLDESTLRRDSKSATVLMSWVGTPQ